MGTRIPPSLDFLVIYNKNLTALPETVPDDDDDAQEEAHILFYTCRQRAVTKDRTLRQVGLAKALASFSGMFNGTTSMGCETVHSMKSRLVMVTPEEHYTIHASVNLAHTVWAHKGKDGQSETRHQYHEESLHDSALRLGLLKAYDEFRLLYGTFESLLSKGRNVLQHKLERFFTVWTHKWDLDSPLDFVLHLGVPIHPHTKHFAPLLQDLKRQLPPDTALLLLSPPYVLAGSPKPFHRLWSILPSYLMSLVPPVPPELPNGPVDSSSKLTASAPTSTTSQSNGALVTTSSHTRNIPSLSSMDAILRANGTATINFLTTMPNVKKWANVLTFRQSPGSSSPSGQSSSATTAPPDRSDDKTQENLQLPSSRDGSVAPSSSETEPATIRLTNSLNTSPVDQTSLTDAIASINQGLLDLPEPNLQKRLQQQHLQADGTASRVVSLGQDQVQHPPLPILTPDLSYVDPPGPILDGTLSANSLTPTKPLPIPSPSLHSFEPGPGGPIQEDKIIALGATPSCNEKEEPAAPTDATKDTGETPIAPALPIPVPPPEALFVSVNVHLEDPETRALRMRRAYHMSLNGTLFAMVLPPKRSNEQQAELSARMHAGSFSGIRLKDTCGFPSYDDIPQGFEYTVVDLLKRTRELQKTHAIVGAKVRSNPDGSSNVATTSTKNFIVGRAEHNVGTSKVIVASPGWSSTSGWLYESAEALRRDKMISEQFSRTATSQTWYIAKRVPTTDGEQNVHMEIGRKQSSLVDVDNDLASLVQRLDSQGNSL